MGPIFLHREQRIPRADGVELDMGPAVYRLLEVLMLRSPGWVHLEALGVSLWGNDHEHELHSVRVLISYLRRALGVHGAMVENKHGFGYRIIAPD